MLGAKLDELPGSRSVAGLRARYERTLADRPWKQCPCAICQSLSIEVVIFRASNRNKRRGIHNLGIYKALIDSLPASSEHHENIELLGDTSSSKSGTHRSVIRRSRVRPRSEEHTSELQSLMRISYAVFCLKKKPNKHTQ